MAFAVMIARQRSGTGAVGEALAACAGLEYCREILLPQERSLKPHNFYGFIARLGTLIVSSDDLCSAFERYLDEWEARSEMGLLDIKIAQPRSFAPSFWSIIHPPW